MIKIDIRKHDGLARAGILSVDDKAVPFPAVLETGTVFPSLAARAGTNVPLGAPAEFVKAYLPDGREAPVTIHPNAENRAESGDVVMPMGWHTAPANPRQYVTWLKNLKNRTPADTLWYAPGAALPSNVHILCYSGFGLFDYIAVDLKSAQGFFCTPEGEFPADAQKAGICACEGCKSGDLRLHNRLALEGETGLVRYFIGQAKLRELVEARCRMNANHVAIMRHIDHDYAWSEPYAPIARSGVMRANSGESMQRVEVRRFAERLISRYIPPKATVAVLLPCSAKKPYSLSQSHRRFQMAIAGRAHELIVTSPLGLVPRELECVYPAMHYDVPVTGYWDAEECAYIADILAKYLTKNKYDRVIAHLEGGALKVAEMAAEACGITLEYTCREHPTGEAALSQLSHALDCERKVKDDRLHGMLSYQFGCDVDTRGMLFRGHFPEIFYTRNNQQLFSIDTGYGLLRPTFEGWDLIPEGYRVQISDFVPEGDVLVPGIVDADPEIREGDEVLVVGKMAVATGRAAMTAAEMKRSKRGVAVRVRKVKKSAV
ncbi:archaeosine synthase subunit alpha [Methanoregula sp. UBA64]|jgi:archaeosine synthase alpha-subunit|uniref:archaeosine synthase subunit alpha n=1 Tax=Methanoregula sp. UBA64 TaxID=1915554 RepID=UPI0025DDD08F|nr:archaeosine synthase subunit alpha [Methanoregula sp. UBA64]